MKLTDILKAGLYSLALTTAVANATDTVQEQCKTILVTDDKMIYPITNLNENRKVSDFKISNGKIQYNPNKYDFNKTNCTIKQK